MSKIWRMLAEAVGCEVDVDEGPNYAAIAAKKRAQRNGTTSRYDNSPALQTPGSQDRTNQMRQAGAQKYLSRPSVKPIFNQPGPLRPPAPLSPAQAKANNPLMKPSSAGPSTGGGGMHSAKPQAVPDDMLDPDNWWEEEV